MSVRRPVVPTNGAASSPRPRELPDDGRKRLLDAAEQLFSEIGYDKTSTRDIEARSGVSRGSIPWHFENKDGLLIAVLERLIEQHMPKTFQRPADASMSDLVGEYRELVGREPSSLLFMLLTEALSDGGRVHEQYVQLFRRRRRAIGTWVRLRTREERCAPTDARAMATVINGALLGIQLQWALDPDSVDFGCSLEMLADLVDSRFAERERSSK